jgi:hypothetical protein
MKEIKLTFGPGGRVKVLDNGLKKGGGTGSTKFTEKLAEELGEIEERHKGETYEQTSQEQQIEQRQ